MPRPLSSVSPVHCGTLGAPSGRVTRVATTMAIASPSSLGNSAPVRPDSTMYAAQKAPASRASRMPRRLELGQGRLQRLRDQDDAPGPPRRRRGVHPPARQRRRQGERADELDGHGDPDRQVRQGAVEREVHQPEGHPEGDDGDQALRE